MLTIDELKKLNSNNIDLDEKMNILSKTDEIDNYLIKLSQRFKEKIEFDRYYLSYSGGKDSHLLYWFIKEVLQDNIIKIVGINTYMEHHQIRDRIFKNCDIVLFPKLKPMEIKEKYGIPCFSKSQDGYIDLYQRGYRSKTLDDRINGCTFINKEGKKQKSLFKLNNTARKLLLSGELHRISPKCCTYLKKKPAHNFEKETGLKAILGVRGNESFMRKARYQTCLNKNGKFTPLWDLTDEMETEIYKRYNIEIPNVYQYISRTGCMGCPYGSYKGDTEKELELINDSQRKFVCEYFKESYKVLGIDTNKQFTIFDYNGENKNV